MAKLIRADRDQVLDFRAQRHNLTKRAPAGDLLKVVGVSGLQNTSRGSAALALHARVDGLRPEDFEHALTARKSVVEVWSLRLASICIPTADLYRFTTGLAPRDDALPWFELTGTAVALHGLAMTFGESVDVVAGAMQEILDWRVLTKSELSTELTKVLPPELLPWCERCRAVHVPEQLFRATAWRGVVCIVAGDRSTTCIARTDQWIEKMPKPMGVDDAHSELVRRYLRCNGPSTPEDFGDWAGITRAQAGRSWAGVGSELVEVDWEGRQTWILKGDRSRLTSAPRRQGVRLLPPYDPWLLQRDRRALVPVRARAQSLWRPSANPGALLVDGEIVGLWRPWKRAARLQITVQCWTRLPADARVAIEYEAASLAPYRRATSVDVVFDE